MIAVYGYDMLCAFFVITINGTLYEVIHLFTEFKHGGDGWGLMVGPEELHNLVVELLVVVFAIAGVDDKVVGLAVLEFHEAGDVVDGVAVGFL